MNEKVCAIIVTYEDRLRLLKRSVKGALAAGCGKVLIVDNGSSSATKKGLSEMKIEYSGLLHLITLEENTGSAGGFGTGLMAFEKNEPEFPFLWLLDDDNIPDEMTLVRMIEYWHKLPVGKETTVALNSFRKDRPFDTQVLMRKEIVRRHWRINSFLGFHCVESLRALLVSGSGAEQIQRSEAREIYAGSYGGLFLHRNLLSLIGYPNVDLFTYNDDTEYTYRIRMSGGRLLMVFDSVICDSESSWSVKDKGNIMTKSLGKDELVRLYYSVRNRVYFERRALVSCQP